MLKKKKYRIVKSNLSFRDKRQNAQVKQFHQKAKSFDFYKFKF